MTEAKSISAEQLKRLQTLYSQFAAKSDDPRTRSREERLMWASLICNRTIGSFSELTAEEAGSAIDVLSKTVGLQNRQRRHERMSADRARRHGIDGRYDGQEYTKLPELATPYDLQGIERYYARLGWTRDNFEAWLRSPRSPLGRKPNPQIRTVAEANRVRWALKRMLQKQGLWEERQHA